MSDWFNKHWILLAFALLMGCASNQWEGCTNSACAVERFEPAFYNDPEMADYDITRKPKIAKICAAFFEQKKYSAVEDCLQRYERITTAQYEEDKEAYDGKGGFSTMFSYQDFQVGTADLGLQQARLNLEYGQPDMTYQNASHAISILQKRGLAPDKALFRELQRIAGIAAAFMGLNDVARKHADIIDTYFYGLSNRKENSILNKIAVADIHLALKDYDVAYLVMQRENAVNYGDAFDLALSIYLLKVPGTLPFNDTFFKAGSVLTTLNELDRIPESERIPQLFRFAKTAFWRGSLDRAKEAYQRFIDEPDVSKRYRALYYDALADLATIAEQEGKKDLAQDYLVRSIDELEKRRSTIHSDAAKIGYMTDNAGIYRQMVSFQFRKGDYPAALEYAERAKGRALIDLLAMRQSFGAESTELSELLGDLRKKELAEADIDNGTISQGNRRSISGSTIESRFPEIASLVTLPHTRMNEMQQALPDNTTLLYYFGVDEQLLLWLVTKEKIEAVAIESSQIESLIKEFLHLVKDPDSTNYLGVSQQLYTQLIGPVADRIQTEKLLIVPWGALHELPFGALHDGRFYLAENHEHSILPNMTLARQLAVKPDSPPAAGTLVMANPKGASEMTGLPMSEIEASGISAFLDTPYLVTGSAATETFFRKKAPRFNRIHYAGHATYSMTDVNQSSLFMAADSENDGRLTLPEIYDIRLNADLVTLSACETALGDIVGGDEVIGLNRAFLYAGAKSVVSSLWRVSDEDTAKLMIVFYQQLQKRTKAKSMQIAQAEQRMHRDHPFYWASFQLTGL